MSAMGGAGDIDPPAHETQLVPMRARLFPLIATISLSACAAVGPSTGQLADALERHQSTANRPNVRRVRCQSFAEEPTEFACIWRQRGRTGDWEEWSTYVAMDRDGYVLIDEPDLLTGPKALPKLGDLHRVPKAWSTDVWHT
jgi:hypothetical protein